MSVSTEETPPISIFGLKRRNVIGCGDCLPIVINIFTVFLSFVEHFEDANDNTNQRKYLQRR